MLLFYFCKGTPWETFNELLNIIYYKITTIFDFNPLRKSYTKSCLVWFNTTLEAYGEALRLAKLNSQLAICTILKPYILIIYDLLLPDLWLNLRAARLVSPWVLILASTSVSAKNEKTTQEQINHRSIEHVGSHTGKERFSIECRKTKNHTNYLPVQLDYSANLKLHSYEQW